MRRYSRVEAIWISCCPNRWLDESQRLVKRRMLEARHYRRVIGKTFRELGLEVREVEGSGKNQVVHTFPTTTDLCYMDELNRFFVWRVDQTPIGVRPERVLEPGVERNLALAMHEPVQVRQVRHHAWILVGQEPAPSGRLPKHVAFSEMTPPTRPGLWLPIGIDAFGQQVWHNLGSEGMPHILVGGATGSGKSNLINAWLVSLCSRHTPEQLRLWLVDLKRVELSVYRSLPHTQRVAVQEDQAAEMLDRLIGEMEGRFKLLEKEGARKVDDLRDQRLPRIVLVVDELSALSYGKQSAENIRRLTDLAQRGRAACIHVVLATQRPSVDVCPGSLKTNIPVRLALAMATMQDSRVILDQNGAEELSPPGQAILARGTEARRVMTPELPDAERKRRLAALQGGQVELDEAEKRVLEAARALLQNGHPPSTRAVWDQVRGQVGKHKVENALRRLSELGWLEMDCVPPAGAPGVQADEAPNTAPVEALDEAPSQAGFSPLGAAGPDVGAAPPRYVWDPPEPLFSEEMLQAKGVYGRARPNPAFKSSTLPQWLLAHAWAVLGALLAAGAALTAFELLVYVARALPWWPTIAILARVEWAYLAVLVLALGLMIYQFVWDKVVERNPR